MTQQPLIFGKLTICDQVRRILCAQGKTAWEIQAELSKQGVWVRDSALTARIRQLRDAPYNVDVKCERNGKRWEYWVAA